MGETAARPFTAASFNHFLSERKLMASHCSHCDALFLPPRAICPQCQGEDLAWMEVSGRGKLAAYTVVYIAPTFMINQGFGRDNPYLTGIVELEEGPKVSARLVGFDPARPELVEVGTPLNVVFLDHEEGETTKTDLAFEASS